MKKYIVINGPNLNLLGRREPLLYGSQDFQSYFAQLQAQFEGLHLEYEQYNDEHALINALHDAFSREVAGVVLNPAAFSHTSIAIADAVAALVAGGIPVIEVHISNVYGRDLYRHHSYVSKYASGIIVGLGLEGYRLAIQSFINNRGTSLSD